MAEAKKEIQFDETNPSHTGIKEDVSKLSDKVVEDRPELWRERAKRRTARKLTDPMKQAYLMALEQTGKISLAIKEVGLCRQTIMNHRKVDPVFDQACEDAVDQHAMNIVNRLETEAIEGHTQPIFDKEGEEIGEKRIYETGLRTLVLKRYDPEYKDRQALDVTSGGKELAAPPQLGLDDWVAAAAKARDKMLEDQAARDAT